MVLETFPQFLALAAPGSSPDLILHPRASSGPRANPPTSASRDPSAPGPTLSAETLHLPKRPVGFYHFVNNNYL